MSHLKERKEKTCLNCNSPVEARYCSVCGQENLEPQEGVFHLVSHFFNDITHFDGKFFVTLKDLILKPGFLSREYVAGKRASYLNPVRMYIFTSFIFFFIFFSFVSINEEEVAVKEKPKNEIAVKDSILHALKNQGIIDTMQEKKLKIDKDGVNVGNDLSFGEVHYRDRKQYDSLLAAGKIKHGWLKRWLERKQIELNGKYGNDQNRMEEIFFDNVKHYLPQMFFFSLPFVALFMKLLYIRRKKYYYVAHAIFIVHLFIFVYIAMLVSYGISALSDLKYLGWLDIVQAVLIIGMFWYAYKAMRKFYEQRRAKTIFKYFIFLLGLFIILSISMLLLLAYSYSKL